MVITKLILKKYKRLSLNNIDELVYTPNEKVQIILGTNGSGKSSLIRELTPLPSDIKKDYKEGGYKLIEIEHDNKKYIISSGLVGNNKHSFEVDGIELNNGGLRKIQLQLVEEHFNITPHIHEILIGNTTFTNMSVNDRKKWLSKISNIDYSYSINVFNKLKSRHRDILGAIKITQNKSLQEDIKLLDDNDKVMYKNHLEALNSLLMILLDNKVETSNDDVNLIKDMEDNINISKTILNKVNELESTSIDVDKEIFKIEHVLNTNKNRITSINKEINDIKKIIENSVDPVEIENLNRDKVKLDNNIQDIVNANIIKIDLTKADMINNSYKHIYMDFIGMVNSLNDYSDINISKESIIEINNRVENLSNLLNKEKELMIKLLNDKKHLEEHLNSDMVECSKCGNKWHVNYDKKQHELVINKLEEVNSKINTLKKELEEARVMSTKVNEKHTIFKDIKNLISNNIILKDVFKYILDGVDLQKDTAEVINRANSVNILLDKLSNYNKYKEVFTIIENKLKTYSDKEAVNIENNNNILNKLTEELSKLINVNYELENKLSRLRTYRDSVDKINNIYNSTKNINKRINKTFNNKINKIRNEKINEMVHIIKYEISTIEKKLNDSSIVEDRVKQIDKELKEYKEKEKVLKLMIKELSPTEGLIAKSINSFLNVFIQEMNGIINTIWSYDMVLLPCSITEDNDLDYKFSVMINDNEIIEDVSKGSSSMKEIFDLAFKIVFMKYLGIINHPLILDEFGKTMDPVHRINAYDTIDRVLTNIFSQIFIISHFESMYGRFSNVDVNVLSTNNLVLDDKLKYNKVLNIS